MPLPSKGDALKKIFTNEKNHPISLTSCGRSDGFLR